MNPAEWTDAQWFDVLKTAAGLILTGIVIPYVRKAVKESKAANEAAQKAAAHTSQQRRVDGEVQTVSNATQLEDIVASQDQVQAAQQATDKKLEDLSTAFGRMAVELAKQRGPGTRRMPTEEVPRLVESAPPPPTPVPEPAAPEEPEPEPQPAGPSLTTSVPLPRSNGN